MNRRSLVRHIPLATAGLILGAMFLFGAARYPHFGSIGTVSGLFAEYAFVGIAAVGATLVIISGGIDLSVGAVVSFTSILIASLVQDGFHPLTAAAISVAIGSVVGCLMGSLIHKFELPAFMVTLAGMFAMRAMGFIIHPQNISIDHPFYEAARHAGIPLGGSDSLPARAVVFLITVALGIVLARYTTFGRNIYALGGAERSARMMGVPVGWTRVLVYTIAGATSAFAGFVFTMYKESGDPASAVGLELDVIAAVVIGGTLLAGGVGSVAGTVVGVLILGVIRLIIDNEGSLNAAWTSIAVGVLLLAFVGMQNLVASLGVRAASKG